MHQPVWRVYYDDGTVWGSDDGPWENAPVDGVIFAVARTPGGVDVHSGCDYYVMFEDGSLASTGDLGPLLRRRPALSTAAFKIGRWTSHARFESISARVRGEWR